MTLDKTTPKPARTPENTPVPGGGSWRWDYSACCWLARVEPPAPTQTAAPITETEPTPE
jgi:hypothetical protein